MFLERLTENETKRVVTNLALQQVRLCCPTMEDGLCCSSSGECERPDLKAGCCAHSLDVYLMATPAQFPRCESSL